MKISVKSQLFNEIKEQLDTKITSLQAEITSAKESRDADTKSSAGDKYETGREMMQAEIDKNQAQLSKTQLLKNELLRLDPNKKQHIAEYGSLVTTTQGIFYIALGIGKTTVGNESYFVISLASPIGQILRNKRVGQKAVFNNKPLKVTKIE